MAYLFGYLAIGAAYAAFSMYGFVNDPNNPQEAELIAEILRQHLRLRCTVFLFFTFGWLPMLAWVLFKILRDELI